MTGVAAALLLAVQPAAAQAPVSAMSCEAIGAELTQLVRSTMSGTQEQVRLARVGERTLADEALSQVGGLVSGFLPNAAGAVLGMVEHGREQQRQREADSAQRRMDEIDAEQDGVTDRILLLHEEHQRRCLPARTP